MCCIKGMGENTMNNFNRAERNYERSAISEWDRICEDGEKRAERIDEMAENLYIAKLAELPVAYRISQFGTQILNLDDVLGSIFYGKTDSGVALACAIRDNDEAKAGKLIIKVVTDYLRAQAEEEAEENA